MALLSFAGNTTTSITLNASHNGSTINGYRFFVNGTAYDSSIISISATTSTSFQKTLSGLSPGTSYNISFYVFYNGTQISSDSITASTQTSISPPSSLSGYVNATKSNTYAPATITFDWSSYSGNATGYRYVTSTGSSNSTTSKSYSIGSEPAGTYYINVTPYNAGGDGGTGYATITINDPPTPSQVNLTGRIEGGLNVNWGAVSGVSYYELSYKPSVNSVWQTLTTSNTTASLSPNTYGLTYDFRVRAFYGSQSSGYSNVTQATTAPKTPSISGEYNQSTVTIYGSGMNASISNWDFIVVERRLVSDQSVVDYKTITTNGGYVQWNIAPNSINSYYFIANSKITVSGGPVYSVSYSSRVQFNRPSNFAWAYSTIQTGASAAVNYRDWNNLASKINEFRRYKGKANYSFTSATGRSGQNIPASMFNELVTALTSDGMTSYMSNNLMPSTRGSGDIFYASYLNNIVTSLNSIS